MTTTMTKAMIVRAVPPKEQPTTTPTPSTPAPTPTPAPSTPAPKQPGAPAAPATPRTQAAPARSPQPLRPSQPSRPPQPVRPFFPSTLTFSPEAWLQLQFLCHAGETEIGAFGIAARDNPFHIVALGLPKQSCSCVTVEFDDISVADFFDEQIDKGRTPDQFARVWIHTHPGNSAEPSGIDEATFDRVFGKCDWAVMFILAKGGATTCRLRMTAKGVKDRRLALDRYLDVRVAWEHLGDCAMLSTLEPWWFEYAQAVHPLQERWGWEGNQQDPTAHDGRLRPPSSGTEKDLLDWFDDLDPDEQRAFMDEMHGDGMHGGEDDRYEQPWSDEFDGGDDRDEAFSAAGKEATHAE